MAKIITHGRQLGKAFTAYCKFIADVRAGLNSIVFGDGYVVISNKEFQRLTENSQQCFHQIKDAIALCKEGEEMTNKSSNYIYEGYFKAIRQALKKIGKEEVRSVSCKHCVYSELGKPHPESCVLCIYSGIEQYSKFKRSKWSA